MAERPIFRPTTHGSQLVQEISVRFFWHKGMAPSQKKKNVAALHEAAAERGLTPLLEISTKSEERLGQRLSAFNLKIELESGEAAFLESVFQGSKVFESGGPYTDIYRFAGRDAKQDQRLQTSGKLTGFQFEQAEFPLLPKTAFYDWLYIRALFPHREFLDRLHAYAGFTDIEFNPQRSINCQARSCATFVALSKKGLLEHSMRSPHAFIDILAPDSVTQPHSYAERQGNMFG